MKKKTAIIIGAGPAGLTAAYELLQRTDIVPIVLEATDMVGGIARTVNYKGNRIDIGGHRFFSKSDRVMAWWQHLLPVQAIDEKEFTIHYHGKQKRVVAETAKQLAEYTDNIMLVRSRKSRIYYLRKFFDYPISLSAKTIRNLGLVRMVRIGLSYLKTRLFPIRQEENLEQFFINRFGKELYLTFFKSYTEKVWGVACDQISAAWGAQRVKGLSITKAILHALQKPLKKQDDVAQKGTETSLIEQFLYPKYGPGQMWEVCCKHVETMGGQVLFGQSVERILRDGQRVIGVVARDAKSGESTTYEGQYVFSTMPIKELLRGLDGSIPDNVREVSEGLLYRDFITVGVLAKELKIHDDTQGHKTLLKDNWIYIQESDVRVGRLQIFNNWSPHMVADPETVWIGLEYFCNEHDDLWQLSDEEMSRLGVEELAKIGLIDESKVLDSMVLRVPKTYPAYFGTYSRFNEIQTFVDKIENLFLIGRNGMHRYNNQDHSMLAAMTAVDNILAGRTDKSNIWEVNTETEYHEERSTEESTVR